MANSLPVVIGQSDYTLVNKTGDCLYKSKNKGLARTKTETNRNDPSTEYWLQRVLLVLFDSPGFRYRDSGSEYKEERAASPLHTVVRSPSNNDGKKLISKKRLSFC